MPTPAQVWRCAEVEGEAAAALLLARLVADGQVSQELSTHYHDAQRRIQAAQRRAEQQVE